MNEATEYIEKFVKTSILDDVWDVVKSRVYIAIGTTCGFALFLMIFLVFYMYGKQFFILNLSI